MECSSLGKACLKKMQVKAEEVTSSCQAVKTPVKMPGLHVTAWVLGLAPAFCSTFLLMQTLEGSR